MASLRDYLERRARGFELRLRAWGDVARFAAAAIRGIFSRATYNSATREVVARQIYFTAWQIIGGHALFVIVVSLLVTQILASAARRFGMQDYALEFTLRLLTLEIVPLLTVLFVALRTGAAIATEVSLMRIRNELGALEEAGIDPMALEFVPRVIGGAISVVALTAIGVVASLLCAHFVVSGYRPWGVQGTDLRHMIGTVFSGPAMALLWGKALLSGLAVTAIPIAEALHAPPHMSYAPIAVLRSMVRLFTVIVAIEVIALVIQYVA